MKRPSLLPLGLLASCLAVVTVSAAPDSTSMSVLLHVLPVASVSATPLNFGSFSRDSETVSAKAAIVVMVSYGVPYNVVLSAGKHYSQAWRNVEGSGSLIPYGLFQESGDEWGDGDFDGTYPRGRSRSGIGTGTVQVLTVRGELYVSTLLSTSPPGAYQDVVTVTVYY